LKAKPSLVLYTNSLWESPVAILRVTGPAMLAGWPVIQGNQDKAVDLEPVSRADIVVIQRDFPRYWADYERVVARARAEGRPVVYDTDDLLVDMPPDHSHQGDYDWILVQMARAIVAADAVIASSEPLAAYLRSLNPNTWTVPNYLNDQIWQLRTPAPPSEANFPLVIGYMGGNTHQADMQSVAPALLSVLSRYRGRVTMRLWGGRPPESLLASPWVEWVPLNELSYPQFARIFMQQTCDLFVAPLQDNRFNRAKSAVKFLEYSALGLPGVYSRLPAYEGVIEHGRNGFLAYSLEEWEQRLIDLIEAPELRYRMGLKAQETVCRGWLLSQHAREWAETYRQALDPHNPLLKLNADRSGLLRLIERLEASRQALAGQVQALDRQVLELNMQVAGNREVLEEILASRSWQALQRLQRLRLRLVPQNSRRERVLKSLRLLRR
jgi:glycosyltransferase involved in cell wall biosynthesis